ncbi:hypothetical protein EV175_000062 [Coemansia sp. RSA 1933]|nr:hypothetical protein EV175_000062 [Coemansia sp. RSA 1933]
MASSISRAQFGNKANEAMLGIQPQKDHKDHHQQQAHHSGNNEKKETVRQQRIPKMYIQLPTAPAPPRINKEYLEQIDSEEAQARRKRRTKRKAEQILANSCKPSLDDLRRFSQENYVCSFCHSEEPTFQNLLDHISVLHPWYDLSVHKNIR